MKKILFILCTLFCLTSCDRDCIISIINADGSYGNATEVVQTSDCNLIVNVGDSHYGSTTRAVVPDSAVDATTVLANTVISTRKGETWTDLTKMSDTTKVLSIGADRAYVYAETVLENPYADATKWDMTHSISSDGKLTLTAKPISSTEYYYPSPVLFWGNYGLACFNSFRNTYTEGDECDSQSVGTLTKTAAVDHNIQYATSVFRPEITVSSSIQVFSKNDGRTVKNVSRDNFLFSIQYIYVHSSQSVEYGEDFTYTPSATLVPFKYGLKSNGIFGITNGTTDAFKSWDDNYANLSILPTSSKEVQVVLVCYYMGSDSKSYVYNKSKKTYEPLVNGQLFYLYGTISTSSAISVTNGTNALCPKTGAVGVFIPDVKTSAAITINSLVSSADGNGENDAVITNPDSEDIINYNALFNVDVAYGNMDATWTFGKK